MPVLKFAFGSNLNTNSLKEEPKNFTNVELKKENDKVVEENKPFLN